MNKQLILNAFAGPGAGKSTLMADVFAELKWNGVNCELVTEFAKDKVWEESFKIFDNQVYIFGKQYHRNKRLTDVDVIVTDSPLLLSVIYNNTLSSTFDQLVFEIFSSFNNINYFIDRVKPYNPKGRLQDADGAKIIDQQVKDMLKQYNVPYYNIRGEKASTEIIAQHILDVLK